MLELHVPGSAAPTTPAATTDNAHVGHLATSFAQSPGRKGLVAAATSEAGVGLLHANLAAGDLSDLDAMRRHGADVLQTLAPEGSVSGPGTGFGLIRAAEEAARHAELAAEAPDASASLRTHAQHVATIARGVARRGGEAATIARDLRDATSMRVASPLVARLRAAMYALAEGADLDGDGDVALDGEAGLQQLEAHLYLLLEGEGLARVIR